MCTHLCIYIHTYCEYIRIYINIYTHIVPISYAADPSMTRLHERPASRDTNISASSGSCSRWVPTLPVATTRPIPCSFVSRGPVNSVCVAMCFAICGAVCVLVRQHGACALSVCCSVRCSVLIREQGACAFVSRVPVCVCCSARCSVLVREQTVCCDKHTDESCYTYDCVNWLIWVLALGGYPCCPWRRQAPPYACSRAEGTWNCHDNWKSPATRKTSHMAFTLGGCLSCPWQRHAP